MMKFIDKFKIPTLLGLSIIFLGIIAGLYLVLKEQTFLSQASPDLTPQNITFTNITEDSVVISWKTNSAAASFITWGQNDPREKTVLDDRDLSANAAGPKPRSIHYVTLKNLLPKTRYQFKIISGKLASETLNFETSQPLTIQTRFTPVIGSVLYGEIPLDEGIAYLSVGGAVTQSSLIKKGGNFLIPLSQVGKDDLSGVYPLEDDLTGKITIQSDKGEAIVLFKLKSSSELLPPIKLGQQIDLTDSAPPDNTIPQPSPTTKDLNNYDLNSDGKINAADNAIVLQNIGQTKSSKDKKADLNGDNTIDQKDLDLMAKKLKELGAQGIY